MTYRPILALLIAVSAFSTAPKRVENDYASRPSKFSVEDNDWFMAQRTYPKSDFDPALYYSALQKTREIRKTTSSMDIPWNSVGPSNIGGRITSLGLHPTDQNIMYAGAAGGGLWK